MLQLSLSDLDKPPSGSQQESQTLLAEIRRAVQASQRCIVITGAGISVSSGIPDFRSPDGLFQQLKQKYPNSVSTGKDLFDATLFSDPAMISLFYNFMGELRNLVSRANCTPTHAFIKELDEAGKLLRCYTQNIDSLEKRIGLETSLHASPEDSSDTPCSSPPSLISDCSSLDTDTIDEKKSQAAKRRTHRRRQMTLERTFTRAVQLHGDLDNVELIGALSEYDLKRRPDLLIVIGTSLKIPGIKRMVKEMAHSVHACTLRSKRAGAGKVIFINRDEPPKGWESIFDYYVAGDSDRAISLLPIAGLPEPPPVQQPAVQRQRAPRVAKPVKTSSKISLSSLLAPAKSRVGAARKLAASGAVAKPIRAPRKLTSMMRVVKSSAIVKREQKALPQSPS
ncbi:NAD-dependent deacetylase hst3 [Coemansia spiralis]|uniref:NAD-dependent deacetylase hst3 n=2 Tax=Coemansia TaxID=4863 RepID=A0A9W8GG28_9FUNG|nr:NAD-dependent deacetylase hst3 [Coemansia spiralis]